MFIIYFWVYFLFKNDYCIKKVLVCKLLLLFQSAIFNVSLCFLSKKKNPSFLFNFFFCEWAVLYCLSLFLIYISLLARIMFIVDNNEQLSFNPVISTYFNFPLVFLKSQTFYTWVPTFILNINTEVFVTFTDHFDPNLHWVVAYFIGLCNYWFRNHYL